MPNYLSRQLVYFGALEIVKFFARGTENRRTADSSDADAPTIEDISVHRKVSYFPFAFNPSSTRRRMASERLGVSVWESAQLSASAPSVGDSLTAVTG